MTPTTLNLAEGGSNGTYNVHLNSQPTGTVTITINAGAAAGQFTVNKTSLIFSDTTWSDDQTVTVTPVNDDIDDGDSSAAITMTAAGGDYGGVTVSSVTVNVTDNNTKGVTITQSSGSTDVSEQGETTDTYTVDPRQRANRTGDNHYQHRER